MEKIKNLFSKDKKTSNLIFIVFLLVIVLVFMNYILNSDSSSKEKSVITVSSNVIEENMDKRLENVLSKISGVETVSVLVSYSSTEKVIPVYDTKENIDKTTDEDKTSTKTTIEKNVAYEGDSALLESKEVSKASGAIVVVTGTVTEDTKAQIKEAVSFTTGAPIHKIQLFVN